MKGQIIYYSVGNGDTALISITENNYTTDVLVDCKILQTAADASNKEQFDVKADLMKRLKKKSINDVKDGSYTDIFILTHGDDDHVHGFENNFFTGDPKKFKQKNKDNGEIFIDVLWFSPMVMGSSNNDDEDKLNNEAKRRIKLHVDNHPDKDIAGNKIVIIGYDDNEKLEDLHLVRKLPGDIVSRFNDRELQSFSIFIHAPFSAQLNQDDPDRNYASIVFQARFKNNLGQFCCFAMFGGDSDHKTWSLILEKTKKKNNHILHQALTWDLFLSPHHCSWSFFNDRPQHENTDPKPTSLEILSYKRANGYIIASSKKVLDDDDNPPHYQAKEEYLKKLNNNSHFLNTAIEPTEQEPKFIIFEITDNGLTKLDVDSESRKLKAAVAVASKAIIQKPWAK